jgi:PAS domain S-box-containing protein
MTSDDLGRPRPITFADFHPYFQPLIVLRTGELRGVEMLARWNHPRDGWIEPEAFIARAEQDDWLDPLTGELLRKAFPAMARLPRAIELAVNISPVQLRNRALPKQIQALAAASGFALDRLTIEITESALTEDMAQARAIVRDLKRMGCKLALDDFGTGYSSLTHLQSLPFDELKVDRSFTSSMTRRRESRKIVAAVVGLGQSLGLTTVAEGIETEEEVEMLHWLGCELGQGWLYGQPVPVEALAAMVSSPRPAWIPSVSRDEKDPESRLSLDSLPAQRLAQLQAVYDGAPVGLAFIDCNLRYINVNRRLADMNGRPIHEHLGRTVREMIPELFPRVEPYIRRALGGEPILSVEITKPSTGANPDSTIVLSYEPALDEAGEVIGVSVALVDITGMKRAEEAQRETEAHLRHMMDVMPQIPWILDPEGRALDVSQRWLELTGTTGEQWRGFGWLDSLHPDDRQPTLDAIRAALASGHPIDVEYRLRNLAREWQRMRSRGSARRGADGKIISWYGYVESVDPDQ